MILALYQGRFSGRKHTQAHRACRVRITAETPVDFELDGEVSKVSQADVETHPARGAAMRVNGTTREGRVVAVAVSTDRARAW